MKKFLLGIIFIIPILVILAISATGNIIAIAVSVNASSIVVKNSANEEITSEMYIDINNKNEVIIIDILPNITYDKNITVEYDKKAGDGKLDFVKINDTNKYSVAPMETGVARVIFRAKNNRNIYKAVTFVISTDILQGVNIYGEDGAVIKNEVELTERTQFFCDFYPIEALVADTIQWSSENEEIVKVSEGGSVFANGAGRARIAVSAMDKKGNHIKDYIVINTKKAVVKTSLVCSSTPKDSEWIRKNIAVSRDSIVTSISANEFLVTKNGSSAVVKVANVAPADWDFTDYIPKMYTQNGGYSIGAQYRDVNFIDEKLAFSLRLSADTDSRIGVFVNGRFHPKMAGTATIVAEANGITKTMVVEVRERPRTLELTLNKEDGELGIANTRVYGYNWYNDDYSLRNSYQIGLKKPQLASVSDIIWEVADTAIAEISQEGEITFFRQAVGKDVTVSAVVMLGKYRTSTAASFTFRFLNDPNSVNVTTASALIKATNDGRAVAMQNDIQLNCGVQQSANIYGNGCVLDGRNIQNLSRYTPIININQSAIATTTKEVVTSNIVVQGAESFAKSQNAGLGIYAKNITTKYVLEYSVVRYVNDCVQIDNAKDIAISGCILGDCHFIGVQYYYDAPTAANIHLKNLVFKQSYGPSMLVLNKSFDFDNFNKNIIPNITVDGFLEVYNWKTPTELGKMLDYFDLDVVGQISQLIKPEVLLEVLGSVVKTVFEREDMAHLSYRPQGAKELYVSVGLLAVGLFNKLDPTSITVNDDGLALMEVKMPTDKSDLGNTLRLFNSLVQAIDKRVTLMNSTYMLTYNINGKDPRCKPFDPVPESTELYERLNPTTIID